MKPISFLTVLLFLTTPMKADVKTLTETLEVSPTDQDGFQWPYLLHIPYGATGPTLLVMPNNSGELDDDLEFHAKSARRGMTGDGVRLASQLNVAVLVPIFPRPKSDPLLYTHALNRRSLETSDKKLARVDLQLAAMIEHARKILEEKHIQTEAKVLLFGFSASAMFVNRFTVLHPDLVKAVAYGSPGGWPIAPLASWESKPLRYPVGIHDIKQVSGKSFDIERYKKVPQFSFLGSEDLNDSVIFRDSFDKQDEDLVRELFGNIPPSRWEVSLEIYKKAGCLCVFKLYPGIGHQMNSEVWRDVVAFFKKSMD